MTEITISKDTIERVIREWETANPGKEMTAKEFADRMMAVIIANPGGAVNG